MKELELVENAKNWLLNNGVNFLVDLLMFIAILIIGALVISLLTRTMRKILKRSSRVTETLERFLLNAINKVLWVVLLMIALPRLGIDIAPLVAGLGVTGFIVGFAFQESLGNLASGLMIILNQPFQKGDFVEAAGHQGVIQEINMMATTMTTPDNKKIIVPNRTVWGGSIINYSAFEQRRVDMTVGVSYSADLAKTKELIIQTLNEIEGVLKDPAPTIEIVELADSSVNFVVRPWSKTGDYWAVFFEFQRRIKATLDQNGIEIPFPQMDVHHHGKED